MAGKAVAQKSRSEMAEISQLQITAPINLDVGHDASGYFMALYNAQYSVQLRSSKDSIHRTRKQNYQSGEVTIMQKRCTRQKVDFLCDE